jgi:hypothetical protein
MASQTRGSGLGLAGYGFFFFLSNLMGLFSLFLFFFFFFFFAFYFFKLMMCLIVIGCCKRADLHKELGYLYILPHKRHLKHTYKIYLNLSHIFAMAPL